jgi:hypothetical protein
MHCIVHTTLLARREDCLQLALGPVWFGCGDRRIHRSLLGESSFHRCGRILRYSVELNL